MITRSEFFFGFKYFLAIVLDYYISARVGLAQPQWSAISTMFVLNPLSGAQVSKSLYRFLGTLLGAVTVVVLFSIFNVSQELLLVTMGLALGIGGYFSIYDRSPRGYMYMLAGYSVPIIGISVLATPEAVSEQTLNRVLEISLGIFSAFVVSRIFPSRPISEVLGDQLSDWLQSTRDYIADLLASYRTGISAFESLTDAQKEVLIINTLSFHAQFEIDSISQASRLLKHLKLLVLYILPHIVGLRDRFRMLESKKVNLPNEISQAVRTVENQLRTKLASKEIAATFKNATSEQYGMSALEQSLVEQIARILHLLSRIEMISHAFKSPKRFERYAKFLEFETQYDVDLATHRDHRLGLVSGLVGCASFSLAALFWKISDWSFGPNVLTYASICSLVYGHLQEPQYMVRRACMALALFAVGSGIFIYGIYPFVTSTEAFFASSAFLFIPIGIFCARKSYGPLAAMCVPALLGFQNTLSQPDLASFVEVTESLIAGFLVPLLVFSLTRTFSNEWVLDHLRLNSRKRLARLLKRPDAMVPSLFVSGSMDCLGQILERVDTDEQAQISHEALSGISFGLNVIQFRQSYKQASAELHLKFAKLDHLLMEGLADSGLKILQNEIDTLLKEPLDRSLKDILMGLRLSLPEEDLCAAI